MVHHAMEELTTGRPRPVEIEIPWDVLPAPVDVELDRTAEVFPKARPSPESVRQAAELLAHARRPLIWAGGGVREAESTNELLALAEALNAPVIATAQGKGAISEDHP